MYYDDFIARQVLANNPSAARVVAPRRSGHPVLRWLWTLVRRVAWGVDALSRVQHGVEVPPDHGARSRAPQGRPQP